MPGKPSEFGYEGAIAPPPHQPTPSEQLRLTYEPEGAWEGLLPLAEQIEKRRQELGPDTTFVEEND